MKKCSRVIAAILAAVIAAGTMSAFAATGRWVKSGSRWWYRHSDASYTTNGWEKIGGKWYYFDAAGWMKTGWVKDHGKWYFLTGSGAMKTGWVQNRGQWYYLGANGEMKTGWQNYRDNWYYLTDSGAMAVSQWIGFVYVDSSGRGTVTPGFDPSREIAAAELVRFEGVPINKEPVVQTDDAAVLAPLQDYLYSLAYDKGAHEPVMGATVCILTLVYSDGTTQTVTATNENLLRCGEVYYRVDFETIDRLYYSLL